MAGGELGRSIPSQTILWFYDSLSLSKWSRSGMLLSPHKAPRPPSAFTKSWWCQAHLQVLFINPGAPLTWNMYCSFCYLKTFCHGQHCHVNWDAISRPWEAAGYGYILFRVAISFSGLQRSLAWKLSLLCIWVLLNEMQCKRQSITLELEALPPFQDWFLLHKLLLHGLMISLHANALGCYLGALTFHRTKNSSSSMLLWPKHFPPGCWILDTRASLPCCYQQERSWIQKPSHLGSLPGVFFSTVPLWAPNAPRQTCSP